MSLTRRTSAAVCDQSELVYQSAEVFHASHGPFHTRSSTQFHHPASSRTLVRNQRSPAAERRLLNERKLGKSMILRSGLSLTDDSAL